MRWLVCIEPVGHIFDRIGVVIGGAGPDLDVALYHVLACSHIPQILILLLRGILEWGGRLFEDLSGG